MTRWLTISILCFAAALSAPAARQSPAQNKDVGETYNPLLAEKDLEVGIYYLKNKNYDAAIERLHSAVAHRPNYARPRWYLAEAYEKKGEYESAIQYYREFAEIMKTGKEAKKASEKVLKLTKKLEEKKSRQKP